MMKKLLTLLLLSALVVSSCGEKTKEEKIEEMEDDAKTFEDGEADDATSFNDGLVGLQGRILKIFIELQDAEGDYEKSIQLTDKCVAECEDVLSILDENDPYPGGEAMQSALVTLVKEYKIYMTKQKRLFEIESQEEYTEEEEAEYNEIYETLYDAPSAAEDAFIDAQQAFANKHGMQITDNPLDDELE